MAAFCTYIDLWSRYVEYAWRVFIELKVKINYCLEIIQAHSIQHLQLNHIFHCFPASTVQTHSHTRQLPVIQPYPIPHSSTSALWPPSAVQSAVIYVTTSDRHVARRAAPATEDVSTSWARTCRHVCSHSSPFKNTSVSIQVVTLSCFHFLCSNRRAFVLKLFLTWQAYAS